MNDRQQRSFRLPVWLSWGVLVLSPFLLLLILSFCTGHSALDAHPVWSDELGFWRSLLSWNEAGFDTGYYGTLEDVAPFGTLGISGLGPVLIYGWFIKLFGLSHNTMMVCNAVWICAAALVFCALRKPRPAVALGLSALLMAYAPMILYALTSMTECFNYALMLLYLAFLLTYQEKRCPWALLAATLTVLFGCLYRPMYCVLFIPLVLFFSRYHLGWRMVLSAGVAILLTIVCCILAMMASAPNAQGFTHHLVNASDVPTALHMLLSHTKANLTAYFVRRSGHPLELAFRVFYCGATVLCLLASFMALERRGLRPVRIHLGFRPPFFSCFLLLTAAFVLTMMLYQVGDWRDYRRLAPFLWLVIAFFIARWRFTLPVVSLAACAATLLLFFTASAAGPFADTDRFEAPASSPSVQEVASVIEFEQDAGDPFRNTVRTDVASYSLMESLHPGLGMQYGWFTTETTGKSRWILTDRLKCVVNGYENVLDTGDYKVYRLIDPKEE